MSHLEAPSPPLVLSLDTGSTVSSVAVARGAHILAESIATRAGSPESLLAQIDAVVTRAGVTSAMLRALCVLRGPGSFTGLRIGHATALGLHHALGLRVAAMPTLHVLAAARDFDLSAAPRDGDRNVARVLAVVDALRGEWFVQSFRRVSDGIEAESDPELLPADAIVLPIDGDLIGFGAPRLAATAGVDAARAFEPPPLAARAARLATAWRIWDAALLTEPLYLRPAPATPAPRRRAPAAPGG